MRGQKPMSATSIATIGVFVVLLFAIFAWSPLARIVFKESIARPNEPCTLYREPDGTVGVHRNELPPPAPSTPTLDQSQPVQATGVGPHFKLALLVVAGLTALTFLALVALTVFFSEAPSDEVKRVTATCDKAFTVGFSALIGLIGGKGLQ